MQLSALRFSVFTGFMLFALQAGAALVVIDNNSFEVPYLDEDQGAFGIPGWSVFDTDDAIGSHTANLPWYPLNQFEPECRDAQDAKRDVQVPVSPSLVTTAYCAPAALRPCRFATPSQARRWLRSTPANG